MTCRITRAHTAQFSKRKAKEKKDRRTYCKMKLTKQNKRSNVILPIKNASDFNTAKERLEHFYEEKLQGIIIRARARWCEHGEKSTKYFLNLQKTNHVKKHVRKLKINGSITTDPFKILSEEKGFYQELYTSKNLGNEQAT